VAKAVTCRCGHGRFGGFLYPNVVGQHSEPEMRVLFSLRKMLNAISSSGCRGFARSTNHCVESFVRK
jgi:hypothetical protein